MIKKPSKALPPYPLLGLSGNSRKKLMKTIHRFWRSAGPKSIFAESVRSVRTNLSFIASEKKSKIICITSEVAGEGKSFIAVNLSSTLSLIDKKIILIAADLRRSRLHKTFHMPNDKGLSNYLANQCEAR